MSTPFEISSVVPPRLRAVALAAIAETCASEDEAGAGPEAQFLSQLSARVRANGRSLQQAVDEILNGPGSEDACLVALAARLHFSKLEILAIALAAAVEDSAFIGRLLAHVQAPIGGSRPTLGLLTHAFSVALDPQPAVLAALVNGPAVKTGVLAVLNESAPLPERPVMIPVGLGLALAGHDSDWPGVTIGLEETARVLLADSISSQAGRQAKALLAEDHRTLMLRTGSPAEGRSVALSIANALDMRPAFVETDKLAGFPWLLLRRLVPVFCVELLPGERRRLPALPGYQGPVLVACGPDGSVEAPQNAVANWTLPVPSLSERRTLWLRALLGKNAHGRTTSGLAKQLAANHRHGAGRIAHLGRLAHHHAALAGHKTPDRTDVIGAAWTGEGSGLDSLAEPLRVYVPDEALVVSPSLRAELEMLMVRCRMRDSLIQGLGASAVTRYRPGVRALFTGISGTGKTLAAGWVATRMGLPLFRVDLASVTSKYIGETEKNLSQLLARAEQAEVILLFDEADSLFGKRTDVSDANDRFANAQTNYLLQRIENYDGIVLLTSNSQARFDDAFARRLDFVIEFPLPGPEERRALWKSHLGPQTLLQPADLNRISVLLDLNGGQIRNAVLASAVRSRRDGRAIQLEDLLAGLEVELRKLGRQMPVELQQVADSRVGHS